MPKAGADTLSTVLTLRKMSLTLASHFRGTLLQPFTGTLLRMVRSSWSQRDIPPFRPHTGQHRFPCQNSPAPDSWACVVLFPDYCACVHIPRTGLARSDCRRCVWSLDVWAGVPIRKNVHESPCDGGQSQGWLGTGCP